MPSSAPVSAFSLKMELISSTLVSRDTVAVRSTTEPVGIGRAHGEAAELAVQVGQHQADGLGRARRGGDQVDRGGAGAAQVLVRHVLEPLVGRVGVDRGHQTALDPERVVQHLGHRREVFVVHEALEMTSWLVLVVVLEVDAERDGHVLALAGAEMMTFLAPASMCLDAFSRSVNRPVDSMTTSAPWSAQERAGIALGEDLELLAVHQDAGVGRPRPRRGTGRSWSRTSGGGRGSWCR